MPTETNRKSSSPQWLVRAAIAAVLVLALLSIARIGHLYWMYSGINAWVSTNLGLDKYAAMFLAVCATAAVILTLPAVLWFSFTGRRVSEAALFAVGATGAIAILVNTIGNDVCFDRVSGRALCYVADTPEGVEFSRSPGVDPEFGIPFVPYTPAMALAEANRRSSASNRSESGQATLMVQADTATYVVHAGDPVEVRIPPNYKLWSWFDTAKVERRTRRRGQDMIDIFSIKSAAASDTMFICLFRYSTPEDLVDCGR